MKEKQTTIKKHAEPPQITKSMRTITIIDVDTYDQIGVLYSENIITTRDFNIFSETNIANYYSMAITCDMFAEYNNNFQLK